MDEAVIERVARAIARSRMRREVAWGLGPDDEPKFECAFNDLWQKEGDLHDRQRAAYRADAEAALREVNDRPD